MLILGVDTTRDALTVVITDGKKTRFIVSEEGNKGPQQICGVNRRDVYAHSGRSSFKSIGCSQFCWWSIFKRKF